jgi:hypothetical protein
LHSILTRLHTSEYNVCARVRYTGSVHDQSTERQQEMQTAMARSDAQHCQQTRIFDSTRYTFVIDCLLMIDHGIESDYYYYYYYRWTPQVRYRRHVGIPSERGKLWLVLRCTCISYCGLGSRKLIELDSTRRRSQGHNQPPDIVRFTTLQLTYGPVEP